MVSRVWDCEDGNILTVSLYLGLCQLGRYPALLTINQRNLQLWLQQRQPPDQRVGCPGEIVTQTKK